MYNQPFSQPPGVFGAQSAMAQMQSAPSLPAGNPGAREYFNYSMETLSNAAMPQAMMPQGIGSLVPQYQFGGGVSLADAISMASNAPDIESVEAAFDAAGIPVPDFNAPSGPDASAQAEQDNQDVMSFTQPSGGSTPVGMQESQQAQDGSGPGFDPGTSYATSPSTLGAAATSVDPAVIAAARSIDKSLSDAEDTQMQQLAGDLNALMSQMQGEAARGTFSRDDAASF